MEYSKTHTTMVKKEEEPVRSCANCHTINSCKWRRSPSGEHVCK